MTLKCLLENDILKKDVCGYSLKQVVDLFVANYSEFKNVTFDSDGYSVKTIEMAEEGKKFYHIEPSKDSANYTDELGVGDAGSKYRIHTLNFSIGGEYNGAQAKNLDDLALGRFVVVAKLSNGSYVMLGRLSGLEATTASLMTGQEATAFSGMQFVFTCNTTEPALPVLPEAIEAVIG